MGERKARVGLSLFEVKVALSPKGVFQKQNHVSQGTLERAWAVCAGGLLSRARYVKNTGSQGSANGFGQRRRSGAKVRPAGRSPVSFRI